MPSFRRWGRFADNAGLGQVNVAVNFVRRFGVLAKLTKGDIRKGKQILRDNERELSGGDMLLSDNFRRHLKGFGKEQQ